MDVQDMALRIGLALAIGFLIGLERGWKERSEAEGRRAAGLRTFALIGLLGGLFGLLSLGGDRLLLTAGFVTLGAVLGLFLWREGERERNVSATTLVAAMLTFVLGAVAVLGDMRIAAGSAVAAAVLLAYKNALHGALTRISWTELRSGLLLAAMTFIALPLLPDRSLDPWGALNPYELWLLTILIAAVSYMGYAAVKIAGARRGLLLASAAGGLFASTAVTLSLARLARENAGHLRLIAGGILTAGCVMLLRVLGVAGVINLPLALVLGPPLAAAALVTGLQALILSGMGARRELAQGSPTFRNPFLLVEVLRFAALLAVVMLAVAIAREAFGDKGLLVVAALSGLVDVDAVTVSVAGMSGASAVAADAILITVAVNTVMKSVYAWYAGGARIGLLLLGTNVLTIAAAAVARYLQAA